MPYFHTFLFFSAILFSLIGIVSADEEYLEEFQEVLENFLDGRIVGGENAIAGEFPFFVRWKGCGASLIWEDVLLTAAHVSRTVYFSHIFL